MLDINLNEGLMVHICVSNVRGLHFSLCKHDDWDEQLIIIGITDIHCL